MHPVGSTCLYRGRVRRKEIIVAKIGQRRHRQGRVQRCGRLYAGLQTEDEQERCAVYNFWMDECFLSRALGIGNTSWSKHANDGVADHSYWT